MRLRADGVYMNGWPTMQVCYCENCRKIGDPHTEAYKIALMDSATRLTDLYRGILVGKKSDNFYSCNVARCRSVRRARAGSPAAGP
jgi:hypothetical protein